MSAPRNHVIQTGFTLVEVLVALLVMSVIAIMAWQGVDSMVRTRDISQGKLAQNLQLGTVLAQWEVDLAAIQDTGVVPAMSFDGSTLRLTRATDSGVQLVTWSLRPDTQAAGSHRWLRWAGPSVTRGGDLQDDWLRSQQFQGSEPGQLQVMTGLTQWQIYFFRGNGWANAQSSADLAPVDVAASGPTHQRQLLPTGVRLVLNFGPGSGQQGQLTRDLVLGPQP